MTQEFSLWGMSCVQFYIYLTGTGKTDRLWLRSMVRVLLPVKPCHVAQFVFCEIGYRCYVGCVLRCKVLNQIQLASRLISTFRAVLIFYTPYHYLVTNYGNILAITRTVWYVAHLIVRPFICLTLTYVTQELGCTEISLLVDIFR